MLWPVLFLWSLFYICWYCLYLCLDRGPSRQKCAVNREPKYAKLWTRCFQTQLQYSYLTQGKKAADHQLSWTSGRCSGCFQLHKGLVAGGDVHKVPLLSRWLVARGRPGLPPPPTDPPPRARRASYTETLDVSRSCCLGTTPPLVTRQAHSPPISSPKPPLSFF